MVTRKRGPLAKLLGNYVHKWLTVALSLRVLTVVENRTLVRSVASTLSLVEVIDNTPFVTRNTLYGKTRSCGSGSFHDLIIVLT